MQLMITKEQWRTFIDLPVVEWTIFVVGLLLLFVVAPLVGAIPGPGGVIIAGIGLAFVLKTSLWAKRRYVHFKRWQPKVYQIRFERWRPRLVVRRISPGDWTDWALRRRSARRRLKRQKELEAREGAATENATLLPDPPLTPPETWADREGRAHIDRTGN